MVPVLIITGSVGAFNLPIDADGNGKVDFVEFKAIMGMLFATDINEAPVIAALQLEFNKEFINP